MKPIAIASTEMNATLTLDADARGYNGQVRFSIENGKVTDAHYGYGCHGGTMEDMMQHYGSPERYGSVTGTDRDANRLEVVARLNFLQAEAEKAAAKFGKGAAKKSNIRP